MDLDKQIEKAKKCQLLTENEFRMLCEYVKDILVEESNVQPVNSPVTISGDIHGQFFDLLELFRHGGDVPSTRYIFMGDFVDRGNHSIETLQLLLLLKARYPDAMTLIRGNHESRQVTRVYGFYEECIKKYGNANVQKYCTDVFDYLTLSAIVDGRIFAVHGGLSPDISTIDQVRMVERKQEIPHEGSFCDLVQSDPDDIETQKLSPRGAGFLFGSKITNEFNYINQIELIARAHQLVNEGYKYMFPEKNLITVQSAPNYCYRCANIASILILDEYLDREIKLFYDVVESRTTPGINSATLPYFM